VVREGHVIVPREETVFAAGDEVLAVSSEGSEEYLREQLVGERAPSQADQPAADQRRS
jgi:Trk K+ transport system NAD-binding subunit